MPRCNMFVHYFVVGLKPFSLGDKIAMSSEDFMKRARDSLSGSLLEDLERIFLYTFVAGQIRKESMPSHELWWSYWRMIETESSSLFLKALSQNMMNIKLGIAKFLSSDSAMHAELSKFNEKEQLPMLCPEIMRGLTPLMQHKDPYILEKALAEVMIKMMEDNACVDVFSNDQIYLYLWRLIMAERLQHFLPTAGNEILLLLVDSIVEHMRHA